MNIFIRTAVWALTFAGIVSGASAADTGSPYGSYRSRTIKSLSSAQLADLLAGRGMGFALPAELNSYPGPRHALDLADVIDLSPEQKAGISALFHEMQARAAALGERVVDQERALDQLFASGTATNTGVEAATARLGALYGALRYTHLRYHIAVRGLLSDRQIARYDHARGYIPGSDPGGGGHGNHHHGR